MLCTACHAPARVAHAPVPRDGSDSAALAESMDAQVPGLLAQYGIASVGVALVEDGRVVLERAYGRQSEGVPATTATLYSLTSVTKPVSAEVLLRLASARVLSLDVPVATAWIDPDVAGDPRAKQLTVRHALNHQSGLPNWRGHSPGGRLAFAFDPGSAYAYSGEGYDYAARFAERALDASFEQLAQRVVFGPVGTTRMSYSMRSWMHGRLAVPLDSAGRWGQPQVEDSSHWNAGNNLVSTAGDYARVVASVMRGDGLTAALHRERLEPASGPQVQWQCRTAAARCPSRVAQVPGWMRLDFDAGPVFMHTGLNSRPGGERTVAWFEPGRRRAMVVFTSGTNGVRLYSDIVGMLSGASRIAAYLGAQ